MNDLSNLTSKKEITKEFFEWLFDKKNIDLISEIDFSLCPYYFDPYIYYPQEIYSFFQTKAMQRLGKIGQLGLTISSNENSYHTRLEHSKGTYNRKLEEMILLYQNEQNRKQIEEQNLKLYLIAELIKEAGHDIGHLPLSHIMEIKLIKKRNFHEDIGKRILTEDSEIQEVLNSINSELPNILKESLYSDILNSKAHDESNYDVDRLDYLNRDALYLGKKLFLTNEPYEIQYAELDNNGNIKTNPDGSIVLSTNSSHNQSRIDVYNYSSLEQIEKFLNERVKAYENVYFSKHTQIQDSCVELFLNYIIKQNSNHSSNKFKEFIEHLKNNSYKEIDLNEYLSWNDFKFFKSCIEIAERSENHNSTDYACLIIPSLNGLMNFTHQSFSLHNTSQKSFTPEEKDFILIIKKLIKNNNRISQNLKNKNFFSDNAFFINSQNNIEEINKKFGDIIHYSEATVTGYNPNEPIYIKDSDGKIYTLDKHPKRTQDWENSKHTIKVHFLLLPELKGKGLSETEIEKLLNILVTPQTQHKPFPADYNKINLYPLQAKNSMQKVFEELEL